MGSTQKGAKISVENQREAVYAIEHGGETMAAVARRFGVSRTSVRRWCIRLGAAVATSARRKRGDLAVSPATKPTTIVDAALAVQSGESNDWTAVAEYAPPEIATRDQAAIMFNAIAGGVPVAIAAQAAGIPDGEPAVWASRAKQKQEPFASWQTAINSCQAAALIALCQRVVEGMAGWQGSARQLTALRPDIFRLRDMTENLSSSTVEGIDAAELLSIVKDQIAEMDGDRRADIADAVIVPLAETGVDDAAD